MGLLKGMVKAGVAKRVVAEARKPHNQAKVKRGIARLRSRFGSSSPAPGR